MTPAQARRLLGSQSTSMDDAKVQTLLNQLYGLAEVLTSVVVVKDSKKQLGVIDSKSK